MKTTEQEHLPVLGVGPICTLRQGDSTSVHGIVMKPPVFNQQKKL
ncbi:MAG: hypothetical protein ACTTH8_07615 [Treponema sp.]